MGEKEERGKWRGRKGKGERRGWREGFGPPKNFGVAPLWAEGSRGKSPMRLWGEPLALRHPPRS